MTNVEPPTAGDDQQAGQTAAGQGAEDDSVVAPPTYPAYSTPPPEGLHTAEDG